MERIKTMTPAMLRPVTALGALVVVALLVSSTAFADGKIYPGSLCVAQTWDSGGIERDEFGDVQDDFGGAVLSCPIIGDSEANPTTGLSSVHVYVDNEAGDPSTDSSCTLYSYSATGTTPFDQSPKVKAVNVGNQRLDLSLNKTGGPQFPRYYLICVLAGNSSTLFEYEVTER
jgi:hypothetical protein